MALLDSLTSSAAKEDARDIKAKISGTNRDNLQSFFTRLSAGLSTLANTDLSSFTISRNSYEMNKLIRKRNSAFRVIRDLNDKYGTCQQFFANFASRDQELISQVNQIQSVMLSLNSTYRKNKYKSKEVVSIQGLIGVSNENVSAVKKVINEFNDYFTG